MSGNYTIGYTDNLTSTINKAPSTVTANRLSPRRITAPLRRQARERSAPSPVRAQVKQ